MPPARDPLELSLRAVESSGQRLLTAVGFGMEGTWVELEAGIRRPLNRGWLPAVEASVDSLSRHLSHPAARHLKVDVLV